MADTLDDTKARLSQKYLGRAGIHSIGISRAQGAVRIYVGLDPDDEEERVLKEIESEASPYKIITVRSERPSIF